MAIEIVMPQFGSDMDEAKLVRWLKRQGDAVQQGEVIAEIETDKATVELEAVDQGIFERTVVEPGATVPVGQVIAYLRAP